MQNTNYKRYLKKMMRLERVVNEYWDSLPKNMQEEIRVKVYNEKSVNSINNKTEDICKKQQ